MQHQLLVIAAKADEVACLTKLEQAVDNARRVGPAIDVVAEGDDQIIAAWPDDGEEVIQRAGTSMYVADGKHSHGRDYTEERCLS